MKRINLFVVTMVAMLLGFASCQSDRNTPDNGRPLKISTSIDKPKTRVSGLNSWEVGDAIGVFVGDLATNAQYTATNSGVATGFSAVDQVMLPTDGKAYDVVAYYPYSAEAATELAIDLTKDNADAVLWSKGGTQVSFDTPEIMLTFEHKLTRLHVKIDATAVQETDQVPTVKIANVNTVSKMTLADGNLADGSVPADLALTYDGEQFYTYLLPGENVGGKELTVTYNGVNYKAVFDAATQPFEANKYYVYTIELKGEAASMKIADSSSITRPKQVESGTMEGVPSVKPKLEGPAAFDATTNTLQVSAEGGVFSLSLTSEATTVQNDALPDWITLTGSTTRVSENTIIVNVAENTSSDDREATVTLYNDAATEALITFTVKQAGYVVSGVEILNAPFDTKLSPFIAYDVEGEQVWEMGSYQDKNFAKITGFVSGANNANEDWLVSPAIDLTDATSMVISFEHAVFDPSTAASDMTLQYSTDFTGDIQAATWTAIEIPAYSPVRYEFVETSVNMPSEAMKNANVVFAFKYTSTTASANTWQVFNVSVRSEGGKLSDVKFDQITLDPTNLTFSADEVAPKTVIATIANAGKGVAIEGAAPDWLTVNIDGTTISIAPKAANTADQPRTASIVFKSGTASATLEVMQGAKLPDGVGDGTEANPFSVTEAISAENQGKKDVWVYGYILGGATGGKTIGDSGTALMLGISADTTDPEHMMPVQLPKTQVRDDLNVNSNPSVVGRKVAIRSDLESDFSAPGSKNAKEYKWLD